MKDPTMSSTGSKCPQGCDGEKIYTKCPLHWNKLAPETPAEGWEKEFDELWNRDHLYGPYEIKDFIRSTVATAEKKAREAGINEGEDKILKAMAPYTIKADPNQYCATFTHEQFRGVVKEKQEARELGGEKQN